MYPRCGCSPLKASPSTAPIDHNQSNHRRILAFYRRHLFAWHASAACSHLPWKSSYFSGFLYLISSPDQRLRTERPKATQFGQYFKPRVTSQGKTLFELRETQLDCSLSDLSLRQSQIQPLIEETSRGGPTRVCYVSVVHFFDNMVFY